MWKKYFEKIGLNLNEDEKYSYNLFLEKNLQVKTKSKEKIKQVIKTREIKEILHFTQFDNLNNIGKYGLLSRNNLVNNKIDFKFNDEKRFDHKNNGICCSISFPNYQLFYKLRQEQNNLIWVVISIDPSILCLNNCYFFNENAAKSKYNEIKDTELMNSESFEKMFEDQESNLRSTLNLSQIYTTNPQAEVIIEDKIFQIFINCIYFINEEEKMMAKSKYPWHLKTDSHYFNYREDYEYWKKNEFIFHNQDENKKIINSNDIPLLIWH